MLKYSVFLGNVGNCFDRYCREYSSAYSLKELFDRAASIPQIYAVDLVMDWELMSKKEEIKEHLFNPPIWWFPRRTFLK